MLIYPQIWGKCCPYGVGIGGVSEFIQVVYTKPLDISCDFSAVLNLIFDYPLLGKGRP